MRCPNKFKKIRHKWDWSDNYQYQRENTKLYIEPKAYEKICHYTQLVDSEISGFGKIKYIPNTTNKWVTSDKYIIEDVEIFKQKCSGGGTTLNGEQLSQFIVILAKRKEDPHNWRLWWHTHYNFGVCWSGVDEAAIEGLLKNKEGTELISLCINQDLDIIARKDNYIRNNTKWYKYNKAYEVLDVRISPRIINTTYLKCEKDIKDKVGKESIYKYMREWKKKIHIEKPLLLEHKTITQPIGTKTMFWDSVNKRLVDKWGFPINLGEVGGYRGLLKAK